MRARLVIAAAGLAFVAALYLPFVCNGFLYDDHVLILEPKPLDGPKDVVALFTQPYYPTMAYYRPVTASSFLVQRSLLGESPTSFHLVNVGLALIVTLTAYSVMRLPRLRIAAGPAWLAAVLFAVHPVASSCVLPVSGRDTLVATTLVMASLVAFCRRGRGWYAWGLVAFLLALLTKEMSALLPLLLLLADLLGVSESAPGRSPAGWLRRYLPIAAVVLAYAIVRQLLFPDLTRPPGALSDVALSLLYALQITVAPFRYLLYEPRPDGWISWWRIVGAIGLPASLLVALRTLGTETRRRIAFWTGWFLIGWLPTANLLWQETRFAERYLLLSSLALFAIPASLLTTSWNRVVVRRLVLTGAGVLALLYAGIVLHRGPLWKEEAFYAAWTAHDEQNVVANFNHANTLDRLGRTGESVERYERTLALDPDHDGAHNNLGNLLMRLGQQGPALVHFEAAVRINPNNYKAQNNLGSALAVRGRLDEAAARFRRALQLRPDYASAHVNLGHALVYGGDTARARSHFNTAIALDPQLADAHYGLGSALLAEGHPENAVKAFTEALRLDPGHANARALMDRARSASDDDP